MNKVIIILIITIGLSLYLLLKEDKPIGNIIPKQDELKIISPKDLEKVNGIINVKGYADEKFDLVELRIDLNEWKKLDGIKSWDYLLDASKLNKGTHTIYIKASNKDYNKVKAVRIIIE